MTSDDEAFYREQIRQSAERLRVLAPAARAVIDRHLEPWWRRAWRWIVGGSR